MLHRSELLTLLPALVLALSVACSQVIPVGAGPAAPVAVPVNTETRFSPGAPASVLPGDGPFTTVEVVQRLTPSVVQVVTETLATGIFNQPVPSRGVGTGIILDREGHILTNNHVVAGGQRITVTLSNGETYEAGLVGGDAATDTAVIRISAEALQPAVLGTATQLQVGQDVIAIGHALGLSGGPTVSKGVISALGRSIDIDAQTTMVDLIQTDAAINPGNSGGPLVNTRGEVIGINTAIIRDSQGIGFSIDIDNARLVSSQLIERGSVERGFLGISPANLPLGLAQRLNTPVENGIVVAQVVPDSAAARAGLRPEDIIVAMNGEAISNTGELSHFLLGHLPGDRVTVKFFRGPREMTAQMVLGERPQQT